MPPLFSDFLGLVARVSHHKAMRDDSSGTQVDVLIVLCILAIAAFLIVSLR
jgi:hypothetical protein